MTDLSLYRATQQKRRRWVSTSQSIAQLPTLKYMQQFATIDRIFKVRD